ncbi:unnamed protein product [Amoebophrya sp. A120]|nr:unnamed protein product [Amoebophrya sp. A120]|eukprot:GSA120T00019282001.1
MSNMNAGRRASTTLNNTAASNNANVDASIDQKQRGVSLIQQGNAVDRKNFFENIQSKEYRAKQGSIGGNVDAGIDKFGQTNADEDYDPRTGKKWAARGQNSVLMQSMQRTSTVFVDQTIYREGLILPQFLRNLFGITTPQSYLRLSSSLRASSLRDAGVSERQSSMRSSTASSEGSMEEEEAVSFLFKLLLLPAFLLADFIEAPFVFLQEYTALTFCLLLSLGVYSTDVLESRSVVIHPIFGQQEDDLLSTVVDSVVYGPANYVFQQPQSRVFYGPELPVLNPLSYAYTPLSGSAELAKALVPYVPPMDFYPFSGKGFAFSTLFGNGSSVGSYSDKGFMYFGYGESFTKFLMEIFNFLLQRELDIFSRAGTWMASRMTVV